MGLLDRLQSLSTIWAEDNDRSVARLATIVANDGKFFDRIAGTGNCTVATFERFIAFFRDSANWRAGKVSPRAQALLDEMSPGIDHDATDTAHAAPASSGEKRDFSRGVTA